LNYNFWAIGNNNTFYNYGTGAACRTYCEPLFRVIVSAVPTQFISTKNSKIREEHLHMAKTRLEKIADYDEQIAQIKNKQKAERQMHSKEERAKRTRRLCSRHGLLESMLPEIAGITDEQYKSLIEKAVDSDFFRKLLDGMTAMAKDIAADEKEQAAKADGVDKAEKSTSTTPSNPTSKTDNSTASSQHSSKQQSTEQSQDGNDKNNSDSSNANAQNTNSPIQKPHFNEHQRHNPNHKSNGNITRQGG